MLVVAVAVAVTVSVSYRPSGTTNRASCELAPTSVGWPHSLLVLAPGSTVPLQLMLVLWPAAVGALICSCADALGTTRSANKEAATASTTNR